MLLQLMIAMFALAAMECIPRGEIAKPTGNEVEINGVVVDIDDKPIAGAKVYCLPYVGGGTVRLAPTVHTTADAQGRFQFRVKRLDLAGGMIYYHDFAVTAEHFALGLRKVEAQPPQRVMVRMLKNDRAIEGRLIDLEGKPAAGITVTATSIYSRHFTLLSLDRGGDLNPFVAAMTSEKMAPENPSNTWFDGVPLKDLGVKIAATTDANGRFRLAGLGGERIVRLLLEADNVVTDSVFVMTRPGRRFTLKKRAVMGDVSGVLIHPAEFEYPLAPSSPVVGVVRDRDTGKSIPGVEFSIALDSRVLRMPLGTGSSGPEGRFRFTGLPPRDRMISCGHDDYFWREDRLPDGAIGEPTRVDITLKKGIVVRGKVTDKATGKPVEAIVGYVPLPDNPTARRADDTFPYYAQTDPATGAYRVLALPVPGIITVRASREGSMDVKHLYLLGQGADQVRKRFGHVTARDDEMSGANAAAGIDPAAGTKSLTQDFALDPGRTIRGRCVGLDGKPVAGVDILCRISLDDEKCPIELALRSDEQGAFQVSGLTPEASRLCIFDLEERDVGAAIRVKGDGPADVVLALQPRARLRFRPSGLPKEGVKSFGSSYGPEVEPKLSRHVVLTPESKHDAPEEVAVIPGVEFSLDFSFELDDHSVTRRICEKIVLKPGEVRDLGVVKFKFPEE